MNVIIIVLSISIDYDQYILLIKVSPQSVFPRFPPVKNKVGETSLANQVHTGCFLVFWSFATSSQRLKTLKPRIQ